MRQFPRVMPSNPELKRTSSLFAKASRRGAFALAGTIALVLAGYSTPTVHANTIDWTNPAGGDFNTTGNWSTNTPWASVLDASHFHADITNAPASPMFFRLALPPQ